MVKLRRPGRAKKSRPYGLFAPGTVSALAFKHADRFAGDGVEYATDEIELGVALHASAIFLGLFACEFFAAEEVHFSPLHERGTKPQTAHMFRYRDADPQYQMERFRDSGPR
jgi:hypothetical protein